MAKNRKDEHYPVVRQGRMDLTGPSLTPEIEINIEEYLSKCNRRLYRQSRNYVTKLDLDPDATQTIDVFVLNDSWMTERALKMAYSMYLENSEDERSRLKETAIARWEDFRVQSGVNFQQVNPVQFNNALAPVELTGGEFSTTTVEDNAGTTRSFSWSAGTASKYSIIEEYDKAGNANAMPNTSTGDMPYDDLMADDSATMAANLQGKGNLPPYDATGVNGDRQWVKVATLGTGATQRLSTGFFTAPCGIVLIKDQGGAIVQFGKLAWSVKSGDYKGVHAPSMLE